MVVSSFHLYYRRSTLDLYRQNPYNVNVELDIIYL
jgi:hypothetical protein